MRLQSSGTHALSEEELLISRLHESIHRPGMDPSTVLELLATWIETEFPGEDISREVALRFRRRVEAAPPEGIRMPIYRLAAILDESKFPHRYEEADRRDPEIATRLERMRARARELLNAEIPAAAAHGEIGRGRIRDCVTVSNHDKAETVVARLKRDDPDLAERVIRGEISANAAARQKGWRKPRIVVSSPERTADSLRKHMSREDRQVLARLLLDGE